MPHYPPPAPYSMSQGNQGPSTGGAPAPVYDPGHYDHNPNQVGEEQIQAVP